jgi:hypothetical protein
VECTPVEVGGSKACADDCEIGAADARQLKATQVGEVQTMGLIKWAVKDFEALVGNCEKFFPADCANRN